MSTRRIRNPVTGKLVETDVMKILEEENHPVILTLEDGAVLRLKVDIMQVLRVHGARTADGDPHYIVRSGNTVVALQSPENYAP